jgi:hypothetical protein
MFAIVFPDLLNAQTYIDFGNWAAAHWETILTFVSLAVNAFLLKARITGAAAIRNGTSLVAGVVRKLRNACNEWAPAEEGNFNVLKHEASGYRVHLTDEGAYLLKPNIKRLSKYEKEALTEAMKFALAKRMDIPTPNPAPAYSEDRLLAEMAQDAANRAVEAFLNSPPRDYVHGTRNPNTLGTNVGPVKKV